MSLFVFCRRCLYWFRKSCRRIKSVHYHLAFSQQSVMPCAFVAILRANCYSRPVIHSQISRQGDKLFMGATADGRGRQNWIVLWKVPQAHSKDLFFWCIHNNLFQNCNPDRINVFPAIHRPSNLAYGWKAPVPYSFFLNTQLTCGKCTKTKKHEDKTKM